MRNNTLQCDCRVLGYQGFLKANFPIVIKRLADIIQDHDVNILQTFFEDSIFVGLLGKIISRSPVVFLSSRRDIGLGLKNRPWYHSIYRLILPCVYRHFNGIIANSEQVKRYVSANERVGMEKIEVIYNGIDIPERPSTCPLLFNSNPEAIWVGVVASLTPVKRHDLFLKAVAELQKRGSRPNLKVVFLGEGPEKDKLLNMCSKFGIERLIHFEGAVKNVFDYLYNIDIGVLCSDREGLSNAIMEYMACGLPVIATSVGGNGELVDERNGILIPPGDHLALADALERLITRPELRKQMGKASLEKIRDNFSWQKTMITLESYYSSLINARS